MPINQQRTRVGARLGAPGQAEADDPTSRPTGESNVLERQLTPKEASDVVRLSISWLAKARMRGDGPPYTKVRRAVRYSPSGLAQWLNSRQRRSTSEEACDWITTHCLSVNNRPSQYIIILQLDTMLTVIRKNCISIHKIYCRLFSNLPPYTSPAIPIHDRPLRPDPNDPSNPYDPGEPGYPKHDASGAVLLGAHHGN
jgi:hypothetical protein